METSLHRQLKAHYAQQDGDVEVTLGDYRIDVVRDERLIEIQHGSLAAIRDKIARLVKKHQVTVVKPIIQRKRLIRQDAKGGDVVSRRLSPKRGTTWDLFHELMYFTRVFPHPKLRLEVPMVEVEEWRFPGHGKRRRRRQNDHQVEDQKLLAVNETLHLRTRSDLRSLVPKELPDPFHTGDLAEAAQIPRWVAQRVAYCFRKTGTAKQVGKKGNAHLYSWATA